MKRGFRFSFTECEKINGALFDAMRSDGEVPLFMYSFLFIAEKVGTDAPEELDDAFDRGTDPGGNFGNGINAVTLLGENARCFGNTLVIYEPVRDREYQLAIVRYEGKFEARIHARSYWSGADDYFYYRNIRAANDDAEELLSDFEKRL